jgi:hypothetical protein
MSASESTGFAGGGGATTRIFYRIRFPEKAGTWGEFYSSNNGTSQWGDLAKVKALLTRGQPKGYKGRILEPFASFEVVEITERVETTTRVVDMVRDPKASPFSQGEG